MNLEERIKAARLERQKVKKRRKVFKGVLIVLFLIVVLLLMGAMYVSGLPEVCMYEYQTCDTLWELAVRNCPENMDKRKFIREVMEINSMQDSTVYSGRLYIVPIYE